MCMCVCLVLGYREHLEALTDASSLVTSSHFGQTRLNKNIKNTIYRSTELALQRRVHFPERTSARGGVTSQPELMTSQNSSQYRSLQRLFHARKTSDLRAVIVLKCGAKRVCLYLTSCFTC